MRSFSWTRLSGAYAGSPDPLATDTMAARQVQSPSCGLRTNLFSGTPASFGVAIGAKF